MKTPLIVLAVVVVVVAGGLLIARSPGGRSGAPLSPSAPTTSSGTSGEPQASDKAPDFSLKDYGGKTVGLADFAGKPLIINSWASWCPFCREELPAFVAAQKEFGDKATIIAIDRAESIGVAKGYTDRQGTTAGLIFLLDPSDSFYQSIGGFSMPETIFVDKNGVVVDHKRGPMDLSEIRERAQKIFASAPEAQNAAIQN